ncbi:MAG: glycosyltransferase [Deltaproteobacteria bacterium]|nr:glycosyltransferase [Deltaproteobacteria bacterium]
MSVIIPVLNEEGTIAATLAALFSLPVKEVVVVDGGSSDHTRDIVAETQAKLVVSSKPRSRQMNLGARMASGDILLFLHADTRLPTSAVGDVGAALSDARFVGGRFDLKLDSEDWKYQMIGSLINLRSRWTRVATGDQAIFVRREVFEKLGGFPELPLMEDIAFCRSLKRLGRVACLRSKVVTSSRRWEREGVWSTILRMWILKILFLSGVPPARLKRFYGEAR